MTSDYQMLEISNGGVSNSHLITSGKEITITNENVKLLKISQYDALPTQFSLAQNYPNPFNPATTIEFDLPEYVSSAKLTIYNILGEKVAVLFNRSFQAGRYSYNWNAVDAPSGIYIYELRTEKFTSVRKMLLLK